MARVTRAVKPALKLDFDRRVRCTIDPPWDW
jgi:hypothetical protein